jgi:hypothetical protein
MLVATMLATVGAVGVVFYLRFLWALSKESKRSMMGYWLLLRTGTRREIATKLQSDEQPFRRAA